MKIRSTTLTIVAALIVSLCSTDMIYAQAMPDPISLLKKAQSIYSGPCSLYMETQAQNPDGSQAGMIIEHKVRPDGVEFNRYEIITASSEKLPQTILLTRPDGIYQIFPDQKIAANLALLSDIIRESTLGLAANIGAISFTDPTSIKIKLGVFLEKPCYIITEKIPEKQQENLALATKNAPSAKKLDESMGGRLKIPVPALNVYRISIPECFLLSQEVYDKEGNKLSAFVVTSIKTTIFPDSRFDIPKDYQTKTISSIEELVDIVLKSFKTKSN